jgi:hypothetical protein
MSCGQPPLPGERKPKGGSAVSLDQHRTERKVGHFIGLKSAVVVEHDYRSWPRSAPRHDGGNAIPKIVSPGIHP